MGPSSRCVGGVQGWELLDLTDNKVVTTSDVVFYETMSLEVWKSEHGSTSGWMQANPPMDTSTATLPLLEKVALASGNEGSIWASPVAPTGGIAGGRRDVTKVGMGKKLPTTGEHRTEEMQSTLLKLVKEVSARKPPIGEPSAIEQSAGEPTTGEKSAG
ncbi:unnamed protein product [Closterium sp. NIES-53]